MPQPPAQKGSAQQTGTSVLREIPVSPHFLKTFYATLGLTVFFSLLSVWLAVAGPNTDETVRLAETFSTMAKIGFGAIVGLLGGKAL
jgi:hypothetical protein